MIKAATAAPVSDAGLLRPGRSERAQLSELRIRLTAAEEEWHHVAESLERQRSAVRALARSMSKAAARLAHASRGPARGTAPDAVARLQRQLVADQVAYEQALKSYERFLSTAEHARSRLHREMSRLREEIRARES